ncbi:replication initiator protein A [Fusobacterium sp. SYSU M8A802]
MRNMRSEDLKNITHYQVPKWLMDMFLTGQITAGGFKTYTLMYDRLRLSSRNGWIDEDGEVYIKYSYEELLKDLSANSKTTISNNIKELEKLGLISKVKCYSSSNIYYLTIYSTENCTSTKDCTSTKNCTSVVQEKCNSVVQENCTTSSTENLYASKNNYNKNNISKNNYNKNNIGEQLTTEDITSELKEKLSEYIVYRKEIKKPINSYRVITAILNRIGKDFKDEKHLIESLDFSMSNSWQGVFASKEQERKYSKEQVQEESYVTRKLRELREQQNSDKKTNFENIEEAEVC